MPPSNAMENDKKRLRNQFTKDERTRLLAIMNEYGPLLDDKNISILSRKEIWEIIENKFNENGHSGRTSAQLKKYWQNYKYHSKRTKIIHKEVPKPLSPMTKHMVRMLAKVDPEEWAQYDVAVNTVSTKKSPGSLEPSPTPLRTNSGLAKRDGTSLVSKISTPPPQRTSTADGARSSGGKSEMSDSNVVVSTTDVPGSSVTVSVICPEVSSKARTIFWKRSMPPENLGPTLQSSYPDQSERVTDDFGTEIVSTDVCGQESDDPLQNDHRRSERLIPRSDHANRLNILQGITLSGEESERSDNLNKKPGRYEDQLPRAEEGLVQSVIVPREKVSNKRSPMRITSGGRGRMNQSELIGNVIGVVKETPAGGAHLSSSKDCDSMEMPGSLSTTNRRNERTRISPGGSSSISIPDPFNGRPTIIQREKDKRMIKGTWVEEEKGDIDYSEMNETILRELAAVKGSLKRTGILGDVKGMMETFNKVRNDRNFRVDSAERRSDERREVDATISRMTNPNEDSSSTQDFLWLKLYLRLLRSYGRAGGGRRIEILRKFEALISTISSDDRMSEDNEESSDTDQPESERAMEVDGQETNPVNRAAGKLRVRRVSLMPPAVDGVETEREIKVETEIEPEAPDVAQNPLNDNNEDNLAMNSMNYLVQAKLRCAKSELDHQVKIQKLEMEEKQLRVRIAEMTIQETRLRIRALIEERLRATELHELRIAQMAAEKVRSEAEHAARIDASCIATAEGQARINSIERDRERSENFYQMQLRCISANNANTANGNCGVKCKQYQQ